MHVHDSNYTLLTVTVHQYSLAFKKEKTVERRGRILSLSTDDRGFATVLFHVGCLNIFLVLDCWWDNISHWALENLDSAKFSLFFEISWTKRSMNPENNLQMN